jgi:hypothetical protein
MRLRLAVVLAVCLLPLPLLARGPRVDDFRAATSEELALKSLPFAPGAAAAVLDWVQVKDDVVFDDSEYLRIKVFTDHGKKYGDVELPYLQTIASVTGIEARVTQPDGRIIPFSGKVYDKLLVKVGGVRVSAKTFSVPEVQAGSIIEYRYHVAYNARLVRSNAFTVQRDLPVLRELVWVRPFDRAFDSFFTYFGLPRGKKPERSGDHWELLLENIPAFEEEPFSPPEKQIKPSVSVIYTIRMLEPDAFWEKVAKEWLESVEDYIGDRGGIRKEAETLVAGAASPREKLQRLYARVQRIRNLGFEHDRTEAEERKLRNNRGIEDVLRNGYGYSAEINRLFVGLARGAGFDASVVRIAERDEQFFSKNVTIGDQLDGEVAMVIIDGKDLYIDPGTPTAPFGILSWQKTSVPGMRLVKGADRKAPVNWIQTPAEPPSEALTERRATLRLEDDVIKGTISVTWRGQEALVQRLSHRYDDEAAAKKSVEESARKWLPDGTSVKLTSLAGLKEPDQPVVAGFDVEIPNLGSFAGSRALIPLSVFTASAKNPFSAEKRKFAIYFAYASLGTDDIALQIPAGYEVESMPNDRRYDLQAVTYETQYTAGSERTVHLKRKIEVRGQLYGPEHYPTLRQFYGKVVAADQEQLVMRKTQAKASR